MAENTYKPFAYLEEYDPEEGMHYNTERTLTKLKNDCSGGAAASPVTLIAPANHFVSAVSVDKANEQADAWLEANAQAYANNTGVCTGGRPTEWRGANPSCVIESTTTLSPFDFMMVEYKWALGAGVDFDTFTGFINTGTEWDNKYMGFGHKTDGIYNGMELPNDSDITASYIAWTGDNQQSNGVEGCLINFTKMTTDYSDLSSIQLRMAGAWYDSAATGNIDITITTYLGGTVEKRNIGEGENIIYEITHSGGTLVNQLNFSKNIPQPPYWTDDVDAVTNIGYITFDTSSSTAQIVITY